ncbi:Tryptophan/tyrosine permease [Euphorbia peplus]|nr:Tryptophan/tyrosine permease [Euphorbia peplus]
MDANSMASLYPKTTHATTTSKSLPPWSTTSASNQTTSTKICFKKICSYQGYKWQHHVRKRQQRIWVVTKAKKGFISVADRDEVEEEKKKKGSVAGAVALIIGTSIGSGILTLPSKASPAGIIPSSVAMIVCWGFLLIEALLLIEINVGLRRKRKRRKQDEDEELDVISIRTMAQETLGDIGGTLATLIYVFLGYASMVAYASKSGEVIFHFTNLPQSLSGCLFTALFTLLISVGGSAATDQINQWLTSSMIGLLLAIEVIAVVYGEWSGMEGTGDWGKVPATIPVIIFSLVYHDLAPVLCAYLGNDLRRLRVSVLLGSIVPLAALLVWDAVALGLSTESAQVVDPVELLMSAKWNGISYMVEAFSLLAVGTSLIGTLLGFSEFFKEQLKNLSTAQILQEPKTRPESKNWWRRNKISFTAMGIVIAPTLLVSTTVPDAVSAATDFAGGYCMTMLYGVLPPAMAWAMNDKESRNELWRSRPALFGVAIFACGIVVEQFLQDFSTFHL